MSTIGQEKLLEFFEQTQQRKKSKANKFKCTGQTEEVNGFIIWLLVHFPYDNFDFCGGGLCFLAVLCIQVYLAIPHSNVQTRR